MACLWKKQSRKPTGNRHKLHVDAENQGKLGSLIQNDIPSGIREDKERLMHSVAYMMLAVIGNLDAVEFVYDCDGEALSTTVTKEDASAFFGQDVKNCMTSARLTDELLHRAKLGVEGP